MDIYSKNIILSEPIFLKKIWGWEKWHLSTVKNKNSQILVKNKKVLLEDYLKKINFISKLKKKNSLLIKTIKTQYPLSIQVHPNDSLAKPFKSLGKDECWYILQANSNNFTYINFKKKIDPHTLQEHINNNSLEKVMNKIKVNPGELIYIPAGTVHAIGPGITLLEIQQSSDITYRIYDYNRKRKLHLKKGLNAINYLNSHKKIIKKKFQQFSCPYFKLEKIKLNEEESISKILKKSFLAFYVVQGKIKTTTDFIPQIEKKINSGRLGIIFKPQIKTSLKQLKIKFKNFSSQKSQIILIHPPN